MRIAVKFSRCIAFVLVGMMMLSGCSGGGSGSDRDEASSGQAEVSTSSGAVQMDMVGSIEPYEEPVTITLVNKITDVITKEYANNGESPEDNRWTKAYKDRLNIDIKYKWIAKDGDAYKQKFNVMMASEDLPDFLAVDNSQFKQLLEADQLLDLTEVYDKYMNEEYKEAAKNDPYMLSTSMFDGKLMAIAQAPTNPSSNSHVLWIRDDWLSKLNLEPPKTMDDVIRIAEAFAENDLDGVDAYGLAFDKDFSYSLQGFMNSYHAYMDAWVKGDDGELQFGNIQPETKAALQELQKLYEEGIIDKEFAVKDITKVNEDLVAGKVGMFYGWLGVCLGINDLKTLNADANLKAYPITSVDEETAMALGNASVGVRYVATKNCKNPEALMKMANLYLEYSIGEESKLPSPKEGLPNVNYYGQSLGAETAFAYVDFWYSLIYDENTNRALVGIAADKKDPSTVPDKDLGIYNDLIAYKEGDLARWGMDRTFGVDGSGAEVTYFYKNNDLIFIDEYLGLPTDTMAERDATLKQLKLETFTKIIMGEAGIEDFDTYVEKWKTLGGDDITKEVNEWYQTNK